MKKPQNNDITTQWNQVVPVQHARELFENAILELSCCTRIRLVLALMSVLNIVSMSFSYGWVWLSTF
jgi:hypothetical protein